MKQQKNNVRHVQKSEKESEPMQSHGINDLSIYPCFLPNTTVIVVVVLIIIIVLYIYRNAKMCKHAKLYVSLTQSSEHRPPCTVGVWEKLWWWYICLRSAVHLKETSKCSDYLVLPLMRLIFEPGSSLAITFDLEERKNVWSTIKSNKSAKKCLRFLEKGA